MGNRMAHEADYNRLKKTVRIDPLLIDEQLSDLPMLCQEAGEFMAEASADLDHAEQKYKQLIAETQLIVRDQMKGDKTTEKAIEAEVMNSPDIIKAMSGILQLRYEKQLWSNLFDSLRTKTSAMKYYCQMTVAGYITPNAAYKQQAADIRVPSDTMVPRKRETI